MHCVNNDMLLWTRPLPGIAVMALQFHSSPSYPPHPGPACRAPEENIAALDAQAEVAPAVQDDFDLDPPASSLDPRDIRDEPGVRERLARRVARTEVKVLQAPRPGKKLLVLDIDYTLFDLGSSAERADQLARPFLHHFLTLGAQSLAGRGVGG